MRASTLSRLEVLLQAKLPVKLPNTLNAESSAEDLDIIRVENLRLFADDEWLAPSASQILSCIGLDLTPPPAVSTPLLQTTLTARSQRNVRLPARFVSVQSSAVPMPSQSSVAPVPLSQSLTPDFNPAQPGLPRTDRKSELHAHLAQVRKKARVFVPITSGAIVTSSYGGYRVGNSICDSLNI